MVQPRLGFVLFIAAIALVLPTRPAHAQARIDSSFSFQTDPAKAFAIYVPSAYSARVANKAMLAFHPLHANWGNSKTWCDILTDFAEENDLLMPRLIYRPAFFLYAMPSSMPEPSSIH